MRKNLLISLLVFTVLLSELSAQNLNNQDRYYSQDQANRHQPFQSKNEQQRSQQHWKKIQSLTGDQQNVDDSKSIYKPFPTTQQEIQEEENDQKHQENRRFNRMLLWGMTIGTGFLAFVLIKSCIQKRRNPQMRMRTPLHRVNYVAQPVMQPIYHQAPQANYTCPNGRSIDEKINFYETQLTKLKAVKQEMMVRQFNLKKMQQQKQVQMAEIKMTQVPRRNKNQNYGPQIYNVQHAHQQINQNAPFHVESIEPIPRVRSHTYRSQRCDEQILPQRKNIPVGKPLLRHQDNDSSFASEYPDL